MNDLAKLFVSELKDIYDGEHQLLAALSEMEQNARADELKKAFHEHLEQTQTHVQRLERVFEQIGEPPKRRTCHGIQGIVGEEQGTLYALSGNSAVDAALIAAGQKTEHYEITSYGSLCTWARELGYDSALPLLKDNLSEEKQAEERLSRLVDSCGIAEAKAG